MIATGVSHSVEGTDRNRVRPGGTRLRKQRRVDQALLRPAEVDHLRSSDPRRPNVSFGWTPAVSASKQLVEMMVDAADLRAARFRHRRPHASR